MKHLLTTKPKTGAIIFPHLPKCAGTSVLKHLEASGKSIFLDYDCPPSRREWNMIQCERRNREFAKLDFSVFDFIYGHFPLERYRRCDEDNRVILLLRHPVDRAISHYYFWKDVVPDNDYSFLAIEPEILDLKRGKMDLPTFCKVFCIENFYHRYTGLPDTSNFMLVGFTDRLDDFFHKISVFTGRSPEVMPYERKNEQRNDVSQAIRRKIEELLAEEVAWYEKQRAHWVSSQG